MFSAWRKVKRFRTRRTCRPNTRTTVAASVSCGSRSTGKRSTLYDLSSSRRPHNVTPTTTEARWIGSISLRFIVPLLFLSTPLSATTVWDGVYTAAQSQRGQAAYAQYCISCHKADLAGIEGAMKGDFFMERRREDTLDTLYLDRKATMPRGRPGSLPDQTYVDISSDILRHNEMPSGAAELKPDLLDKIDVVGKDGPKPVPNFVPVLSVGCLIANGENRWSLINASEPVRTRDSF